MEEEVAVAANVDEEEELSRVFRFVNLLWLGGLILGETLEEAREIKVQQGYHEAEVSRGGEADLHRHYTRCTKNLGHRHFIPVKDFKIEDLPPEHRDNLLFDLIKATADLTCRLVMRFTSEMRPKYHPVRKHLLFPFQQYKGRSFMRVGTGWVSGVYKYTEGDNKCCECEECTRPGSYTPKKVWGKFEISTAVHVVFDDDEARQTTCYFGYDTKTTLLPNCLKFTGLRIDLSEVKGDWCRMTYVTHNMDIVNKLDKMWQHRHDVFDKLLMKYLSDFFASLSDPRRVSFGTDSPTKYVVIISHPHGCSKHITVGMLTHRQTWSEIEMCKLGVGELEAEMVDTSYTYNAHICPGSSGAPIIRLQGKGKWWDLVTLHYHAEAGEGNTNENKSAVVPECLSRPTRLRKSNSSN